MLTHGLVAALVLGLGAPAPKAKEAPKKEFKIEGTWTVESVEGGGKDGPPDGIKFVFGDGRITVEEPVKGGGKGHTEEATYTLDQTKTPVQIDIQPGKGKKEPVLGIILVDGDSMKLCFTKEGKERPTEFKPEGKDTMCMTLKRMAEAKKDDKKDK